MNSYLALVYRVCLTLAAIGFVAGFLLTSTQIEAHELSRSNPAPQIKHAVPPGSPLQLSKSTELDHLLYFDGTVEIAAKYQFIYEKNSERINNPYLVIYPDKRSVERLPYLPENGDKGRPSEIYVRNPDVVAKSIFDKQLHSRLMNGSLPSVSGEAVFTIRGYWVGYECDQPAFAARVMNVKSVGKKRSYESQGRNAGC